MTLLGYVRASRWWMDRPDGSLPSFARSAKPLPEPNSQLCIQVSKQCHRVSTTAYQGGTNG